MFYYRNILLLFAIRCHLKLLVLQYSCDFRWENCSNIRSNAAHRKTQFIAESDKLTAIKPII